jgi:hypothetical protein
MDMRRTIYLPDELDKRVEEYLRLHGQNLSELVRQALLQKLNARDPWAILEVSGIVTKKGVDARNRPEDQIFDR